MKRCRWYLENCFQIVLLVDPRDETMVLLHLGTEPNLLTHDVLTDLDRCYQAFN